MDQRGLVERASKGDRAAYAELVRADVGRLDTVARLIVRDPGLGRDAVEEAVTRAWRELPGMRDQGRFDLRMYRLTVDACLDRARRLRRHATDAESMSLAGPVTTNPSVAPADRAMVDGLLRRLGERDRAIIALHAFVGLSIPETADVLDLSVAAAGSRFDRALGELTSMASGDGDVRLDLSLPGILEDLGAGLSPEDVDDLLAAVARTRQSPSWTVPGRWLPTAVLSGSRRTARRLPWRGVIAVAASMALLATGVVVVAGPLRRPPPSTGPAGNGLIAYSDAGDIFVGNPVSGATTAIVVGPELDMQPVFSPDGSRIAFVRKYELETIAGGGGAGWQEEPDPLKNTDIMTVFPDGTDLRIITPERRPALRIDGWTADSRYVLADSLGFNVRSQPSALALDANGTEPPRPIDDAVPGELGAALSSRGDRFLAVGDDATITVSTAGTDATVLVDRAGIDAILGRGTDLEAGKTPQLGRPLWSPDGSMVAFLVTVPHGGDCGDRDPPFFLYGALFDTDVECGETWAMVVNVDGSGLRRLAPANTSASGIYVSDGDLAWAPDSARVLLDRRLWIEVGTPYDGRTCCSVIVADVAAGASRELDVAATGYEGDAGADDRWWSPDGRSVLFYDYRSSGLATIDVSTGKVTALPWRVGVGPSWQRVAGP